MDHTRIARKVVPASVLALLALPLTAALAPLQAQPAQPVPEAFSSMEARNIGPAGMSGRITSVAVDPSDRNRIFIGAASGGVWRSENGGHTWQPVFDDQPLLSIGRVSVSPANPDLVWVGTGEGNPRQSVSIGDGVYKSLDGGDTWTNVGLRGSEHIHRILPHPTDPDVAYVGAMGPLWSTGGERGVYKTTDGGTTWRRMLSTNESSGVAEMVMDPQNPDKLLVAMYDHRRWPWNFESGGEGSGIFVTHDGGESWTTLGPEQGIPAGPLGRIGLAIAPSNRDVVYALVEAAKNVLLRSDDGGESWRTVSDAEDISPRPMYYADLRVDPGNENRVYRIANSPDVSEDAGRTWTEMVPTSIVHGDHHDLWIDPADPRHMIDANDGGLAITYDRGKTWRWVGNLPLAQFYQVSVDMAVPFNVYGGVQDSGSWMGPSTVWDDRGIINAHWTRVNGADGFATLVDYSNPRFGYTTSQNGNLLRFDKVTLERRGIRPPPPDSATELRFNWNSALAVDAHDSTTIYFGSQFVHRSRDGGRSWETISPDLSTDDPLKQNPAAVGQVVAPEYDAHTTILAIDTSPLERGVIWATTDDGNVQLTRDDGATWTNVAGRLAGAPDSAYVPEVKASRHAAGRAYVVVDAHRTGDMEPYLYRTENYGASWERMPTEGVRGFLHEVEEDPVEPNLLFVGSEFGAFVSLDRGRSWTEWRHGLPAVPVRELIVHPRDHDLVVGTHGRGIWIVDDVRPLRALAADPSIRARALHVFEPPPARQHEVALEGDAGIRLGHRVVGHTLYFGESRPYGALLSYWVGDADPAGARIEVRGPEGQLVRELEGSAENGVNRVVWNLRGEAPPAEPGARRGREAPEVAPGRYEVTVRVGDRESSTSLDVLPDPRKEGVEFFPTPSTTTSGGR